MPDTATSTPTGRERAARSIRKDWQVLAEDGTWLTVWLAMHVTSPVVATWLTFTNGDQSSVPQDALVMCRTPSEVTRAAKAGA